MKKFSIQLIFLFVLVAQPSSSERFTTLGQAKQEARQTSDAVWISIRISRPRAGNDSDFYFDLQREGTILVFKRRSHFSSKEESGFYSGVLPASVARRIFQVVSAPEVLNARDAGSGEQIFSESDWVNVGAMIGAKFKQAPLWGFTEELKDYPAQFQRAVEELKRLAGSFPKATDVKQLVSADPVNDKRAQAIRSDPRRFYNIIDLPERTVAEMPALKQARANLQRIIPIKSNGELQQLLSLAKESNLKGTGEGFFLTISGKSYQIRLY
jgi:hypothetical protein